MGNGDKLKDTLDKINKALICDDDLEDEEEEQIRINNKKLMDRFNEVNNQFVAN